MQIKIRKGRPTKEKKSKKKSISLKRETYELLLKVSEIRNESFSETLEYLLKQSISTLGISDER